PIFTFTEIKAFSNHYLGKLYFFKQFEAITECTRTRSNRIEDFTRNEYVHGTQLQFKRFVTKDDSEEWIVEFVIISNGKGCLLEPNLLKKFILTENNPEVNYNLFVFLFAFKS